MLDHEFSELRQAAGMTVKEIADELRISVSTAYRYENGECKPRASEIRALGFLANLKPKSKKPKRTVEGWFNFIDLFAGIGGLRRGFEAIGGTCVFTSEWDKYAQATSKANFRCDHEIAG